jgi:uncharacterized membrane protein YoaK (UPF0700 family)
MAAPEQPGGSAETRIGLLIVLCLAGLAGAVDACGFFILKDLYVSFMSGNTTSMAAALAKGDLARVRLIAGIIGAFVTGVAVGTVLGVLAGRRHAPVGILAVAGVLTVPVAAASWSIPAMTFAMGMLNATIHQAGPVEVSLTYITGTLAKLGKGIGLLLCGRVRDLTWLEQAVPFLGLVAGAALATFSFTRIGAETMVALPVIAVLVAAATWFAEPAVH